METEETTAAPQLTLTDALLFISEHLAKVHDALIDVIEALNPAEAEEVEAN